MGHICVDPPNTNNKWVVFGLANVDTFIIRVRFGLANVDTIRTLTRYEHDPLTRIVTPTSAHGHAIMHVASLVRIRPTTYYEHSPSQLVLGKQPNISHL